jgi:hypothetical protein
MILAGQSTHVSFSFLRKAQQLISLQQFVHRLPETSWSVVLQHIRKYLPELLSLIHEYWSYPALLLPVRRPSQRSLCRRISVFCQVVGGSVIQPDVQLAGPLVAA